MPFNGKPAFDKRHLGFEVHSAKCITLSLDRKSALQRPLGRRRRHKEIREQQSNLAPLNVHQTGIQGYIEEHR
jgi:hypothetical protein